MEFARAPMLVALVRSSFAFAIGVTTYGEFLMPLGNTDCSLDTNIKTDCASAAKMLPWNVSTVPMLKSGESFSYDVYSAKQ